jgi:uncharacterized repeat protein (TIGR03803 family)
MFAAQVLRTPGSLRPFAITARSICTLAALAFSLFAVLSVSAQTTHKTLSLSSNDYYNGAGVHASDGNFYTYSVVTAYGYTPSGFDCPNNEVNTCTFITKIAPDGTASIFHAFVDTSSTIDGQTSISQTNVEGYGVSSLIEASDGNLYGTTLLGGTGGAGTIFRITKGGALTVLYTFPTDSTNNQPSGLSPTSLIEGSDGNFYGVTWSAGPIVNNSFTLGNIFKITPTGIFTILYTFLPGSAGSLYSPGGNQPISLLEGADGNFYGTALGSPYDNATAKETGLGTIFSFTRSGVLTMLHNFAADGSEGSSPQAQLVQGPDGSFYGATPAFGYQYSVTQPATATNPGYGNVYKISPSGNFQVLHTFSGTTDGWNPAPQLTVGSDGNLYGTARYGGSNSGCGIIRGCGLVFQMQPSGSLTPYYSFLGGNDSGLPNGGLLQTEDGSFFGTTEGDILGDNPTAPSTFLISQTPPLKAPIQLSFTKDGLPFDPTTTTVDPNTPLVLNWNVLNAYSNTARNCHAIVQGGYLEAGAWYGMLSGTVTSAGYGGSATITPTSGGNFTYAVTCGGVESGFITLKVGGSPLKIVTTSLKNASVGVHYLQTLAGTGGMEPYTWAVSVLPDGLALDPNTGAISGKPTKTDGGPLTVTLTDSSPTPQKVTATIDLIVLPAVSVGGVEFTQSIQVYQSLTDLKASIEANGGPPMPMIAGKPAVMRIYFAPVDDAATVTLQVSGVVNLTRTVSVQPSCPTEDQRSHSNMCPSIDLYFTPPSGTWSVDMVLTNISGDQIQHETLTVTSRETRDIRMVGTTVCDSYNINFNTGGRNWNCGDPRVLIGKTALMNMMMPTNNVRLEMSNDRVTNLVFPTGTPSQNSYDLWLVRTSSQVGRLYTRQLAVNTLFDAANNTHSVRFGIYRHNLDQNSSTSYDTGIADDIPGHGAITADVVTRLNHIDAIAEVVAHETGHTLGLKHTNILVNPIDTAEPGCYNTSEDDTTDWPPFTTNNIQSTNGSEYPFNVTMRTLMDPVSTFEVMSYCMPRWISPPRYATVTAALNGGVVAEPFARNGIAHAQAEPSTPARPRLTPTTGSYWEVSGTIDATGATLAPIFQDTMLGTTDAGTGTYSIVEQDAQGNALYTRYFTPTVSNLENETGDKANNVSVTYFGETIPVIAGVTAIVVKDASGIVQGKVTVSATVPAVTITSPSAGFTGTGVQTIAWTTTNPTSGSLTSRVFYSPDNGVTWSQMVEDQGSSLDLNFDTLPGSVGATAFIKVLVSDGANTGSAISGPFTVPHKSPTTVIISNPTSGMIVPAIDPLQLVGFGFDPDDGMLTGTRLAWTSDLQGNLGTGSPLTVSLQPGVHKLTLTATDSDGGSISTSTSVTIVGQGPSLSLTSAVDNSTACTTATVSASTGVMGANLTTAQYSLNGGKSYVKVSLSSLPYTFNVPGTGNINLVARVYDASGQSNAQSTHLTIPTACAQATTQTPTITWPPPAAISYGTALGATQLNATASVPGAFRYSSPTGTVLSVGPQTITATFTPTDTTTYSVAMASVTVNVTPASLTITPAAATRAYGVANPAFSYLATGFVNGETSSVLSGTPAITTTADLSSAPGSYVITAATGTLSSSNYGFVFGTGKLAVIQADTTSRIQLSAAVIAAGTAEVITATVTPAGAGVPSGTVTILDGSTLLSTQTLSGGTATFTASSLANGNHTIIVNYSGDSNFKLSSATASVTVNTGSSADFVFTSTGIAQKVVTVGSTATFTFTLSPLGASYPGDVNFTVAGLPPSAIATFNPTVVPANGGNQNVTLTVKTVHTALLDNLMLAAPILTCLVVPLAIGRRRQKVFAKFKRRGLFLWAVLLFSTSIVSLVGCGSSSPEYFVTVTANAGNVQHTATVILVTR